VRFFKRYRLYLCTSLLLASIGLFTNSCQKDNSDTLSYFLTNGTWQLASITRQTFIGDDAQKIGTDTLNLTCNLTQTFKFNADNSCTYINYHCINQSSTGSWALNIDNLSLQTTLSAQDTLTTNNATTNVTVKAFDNAQIETLGQYSLVLKTGYTSSYYTSKTKRVIIRYGFVHPVSQ
jgi:hypothetical protein